MFRRFAKRRNCSTLRELHSADLPLKPSLAYKGYASLLFRGTSARMASARWLRQLCGVATAVQI